MKKNIYSLVLSEEVVKAVDALAMKQGSNRSALINQILAEYVSYITPEMRRKQIFSAVLGILEREALLLGDPDETMLNIKSALSFKYHPGIKYSVELDPSGETVGIFKAVIRTQNPDLLRLFGDFCRTFSAIEENYIGKTEYRMVGGCFERELSLRTNGHLSGLLSTDDLGRLIAGYVKAFDTAIKGYFEHYGMAENMILSMKNAYGEYLKHTPELL